MNGTAHFVVLEGGDATGKSTQVRRLATRLREAGHEVVETFEPGATPLGAQLRALLLDDAHAVDPIAEALLMAADRAEHIAEVVRPGLQQGAWVVSDRFIPSSLAYQGVGRGLGVAEVEQLNELASAGLVPDLVVVLDLSPEVARERMAAMRARHARPARARGRRLRARRARGLPRSGAQPRLGARRRVGRRGRRRSGQSGVSWWSISRRERRRLGPRRRSGRRRRAAQGRDRPSRARVSARRAAGLGRRRGGPVLCRVARSRCGWRRAIERSWDLVSARRAPGCRRDRSGDDPDRRRRR